MAARAGLPLQDLEFVQFHPTGEAGGGRGAGCAVAALLWQGRCVEFECCTISPACPLCPHMLLIPTPSLAPCSLRRHLRRRLPDH